MSNSKLLFIGAIVAAAGSGCGGGAGTGTPGAAVPGSQLPAAVAAVAQVYPLPWQTVANTATSVPGGDGRTFNSFNQPSVNMDGIVVLRARTKGAQGAGEPWRGIYMRDMAAAGSLSALFDNGTVVPSPNNIDYQGSLATFTEFPAFPRIGLDNATVVTRGQSKPVWTYTLPDGTETRVGTSGVYASRMGQRVTAASQLGQVNGFERFSVPGAPAGTRFDQFPGAPAVADTQTVVLKGNYTDGASKTGIFFRRFVDQPAPAAMQVIANSDTLIPGQPAGGVRFGSTAPPSAVDGSTVFLGLDNEDAPTLGGIYLAPLATMPALRPLVTIGGAVPGEAAGTVFTRLGEALSYDGQFVSFWGAWGTETRSITLACPTDGQQAVIAYCQSQYPAGFGVQVPVHQGFFVHDTKTGGTFVIAKTGTDYLDFMFWTFSGRPPGVGEAESDDPEPPRWRASAFSAAFSDKPHAGQVAFKARRTGSPAVDGIHLAELDTNGKAPAVAITAAIETGTSARDVDPAAPAGAQVITVGLERDGLRNGWLAIAAGMLDTATSESWAGVYVRRTRK